MFSGAPIGSMPLAASVGATRLADITEGIVGAAITAMPAKLSAQYAETVGASYFVSAALSPAVLSVEGPSVTHVFENLCRFSVNTFEVPYVSTIVVPTTAFLSDCNEGPYVSTDLFQVQHVQYTDISEGVLSVDLQSMTKLWDLIGTGVNAGWAAISTGTESNWTLIKTRKD